jgi:hypothetical protein
LQGDLGFIFNTLKKTPSPPSPFYSKNSLLLPNNPALSRNNPALFLLKAGLLGNLFLYINETAFCVVLNRDPVPTKDSRCQRNARNI